MCKRLNVQYLTIFSVAILRSFQLLFTYFAHDNLLRVSFPKHRENIKTLMKVMMTCFIFSSLQLTGVPTTSPGSTGSGSNLSPSLGAEGGPAVSPLSSSRTGSGMTDPMTGQILPDSSHLAALSGEHLLCYLLGFWLRLEALEVSEHFSISAL